MAATDVLQPYTPRQYPSIPGGEVRFLTEELRRLSTSVARLIEVLKLLEPRIEALEP